MIKTITGACAITGLMVLTGCGNASNPGGGIFGTTPSYATLTDTTGGSSDVGGGLVNGNTFATIAADGTYTHSGPSFFISNPAGGTVTVNTVAFNNAYDYVQSADVNVGGVTYTGVIGLETSATDVAASTNATYTAEFEGTYIEGATPATLANWTGTVTADFTGNDVDMSFTGAGTTSFDQITVTDATISGNRFSGGTLSTRLTGSAVDVTGTTSGLQGAFFGYDGAISAPDEVGGVISSQGGGNNLTGAFIGD